MSSTEPKTGATLRPIERLNPAMRVVLGMALSLPLLLTVDWVSATVALVLELVVLTAARVRPWWLLRRVAPLLLVAPLGAVNMMLYGTVGGRVFWHWGPATISEQSVTLAAALFVRVFALSLPAIALLDGVDATRMADGLAQVLRLPARFVLGTLAGFRLMGLLTQDWHTLAHARRARGLADDGRLRRLATMTFGLLVFALRRGSKLATAMEARGFGATGVDRTWARPSRLGRWDTIGAVVVLLVDLAALGTAWRAGTMWTIFS